MNLKFSFSQKNLCSGHDQSRWFVHVPTSLLRVVRCPSNTVRSWNTGFELNCSVSTQLSERWSRNQFEIYEIHENRFEGVNRDFSFLRHSLQIGQSDSISQREFFVQLVTMNQVRFLVLGQDRFVCNSGTWKCWDRSSEQGNGEINLPIEPRRRMAQM